MSDIDTQLDQLFRVGHLSFYATPHPRAPQLPNLAAGFEIMQEMMRRPMPEVARPLYARGVSRVGEADFINPAWEGWRNTVARTIEVKQESGCAPLFYTDGASYFGLDLTGADEHAAVYFFDHSGHLYKPDWAAASTLAHFLVRLGELTEEYNPWSDLDGLLSADPNVANLTRAPLPQFGRRGGEYDDD